MQTICVFNFCFKFVLRKIILKEPKLPITVLSGFLAQEKQLY